MRGGLEETAEGSRLTGVEPPQVQTNVAVSKIAPACLLKSMRKHNSHLGIFIAM